jgi:hypothetical protein
MQLSNVIFMRAAICTEDPPNDQDLAHDTSGRLSPLSALQNAPSININRIALPGNKYTAELTHSASKSNQNYQGGNKHPL